MKDVQTINGHVATLQDTHERLQLSLTFGEPLEFKQTLLLLGGNATSALASKVVILDKIGKISDFIEKVINFGDILAELHPVAKVVLGMVKAVFQKFQQQRQCHKIAVDLAASLHSKLPFADMIPENMQNEPIREALREMLDVIQHSFVFLERYATSPNSDELLLSQRDALVTLKSKLSEASANFSLTLAAQHFILAKESQQQDTLERLRPVLAARFSQGHSCLEGTRIGLLEETYDWSAAKKQLPNLLWMYGFAGSGKSSIAATICERLKDEGTLAGSFFCKADIPDQRDTKRILPSLSYMLTLVCKPYKDLLVKVLEKEPDIATALVPYQMKSLFLQPFAEIDQQKDMSRQPLVFVIDALDECGNAETRSEMAACLCQIASLADWLKVFVTSRPLPELSHILKPVAFPIDLNAVDAENDITRYTKSCLKEFVGLGSLDDKWTQDDVIKELSKRACGLFIWMSTVMRFIRGQYDQEYAIEMILSGQTDSDPTTALDSLYTKVIQTSRGGSDNLNLSAMKAVLGIIHITARNKPLSLDALYDFMPALDGGRRISMQTLRSIVDDLRSVLYEDTSKNNIIRVCHPSFLDFLENHARSGNYWTNPEQLHQMMIEKYLNLMRSKLKFNICGLETSYLANSDVQNLEERIRINISESLHYSCLYWLAHYTSINSPAVEGLAMSFFGSLQVLYWLEALSLTKDLDKGVQTLQSAAEVYKEHPVISGLAKDLYKMASAFSDMIGYSTPHLYVSALTWLPEESVFKQLVYPLLTNQPLMLSGRNKTWHTSLWINAMDGNVTQVVFSPDGCYVAGSSSDNTISIWQATNGMMVTRLRGHSGPVRTIAYTLDGRHLASGSDDCSVRIWDVTKGVEIVHPSMVHSAAITSVSCSPDGKAIASRSGDRTVKIWSSVSKTEVRKLEGLTDGGEVAYSPHGRVLSCCGLEGIRAWDTESWTVSGEFLSMDAGRVVCMAYSPNGVYLASGCSDWNVRLHDGDTLNQLAVLKGHSGYVYPVAFSPDGSELLSSSCDTTMVKWDVETKQMLGSSHQEHEAEIMSVAYSPNGRYVASGSLDKTVRLWNIQSFFEVEVAANPLRHIRSITLSRDGKEFASAGSDGNILVHNAHSGSSIRALTGHTDEVNSVAYSPKGRVLASVSDDCTVRVWDSQSGAELLKFKGHEELVFAVIFTLNGSHIISASFDKTIRRWPIDHGAEDGEVFLSHTDRVLSLCLSPDGKLLVSGGYDQRIRFSNSDSGAEMGRPCLTDTAVRALAFSPDGRCVASGSDDHLIRVWDIESREEIKRLEGHTDWINCLSFSSDGKQLLSGSGDGTIRRWDFQTGVQLCSRHGHTHAVECALYTLDENRIISSSNDGTCRIWGSDVSQTKHVREIDQDLSSVPLVDGWIKSRKGDLLLWVPPEYRNVIRDMCEFCVPADAPGHPIKLDWSKLIHGEKWATVLKLA